MGLLILPLHLNLCLTFSSSLWLSRLFCFPLSKSQLSVREIENVLYVNHSIVQATSLYPLCL